MTPSPDGNVDATSSTAIMGTPAFMPPEQALAQWKKVDGRTDLFALGATAFTMLSGRLVHEGSTIPELLIAASTRPPRSLRAEMPELDAGIALVIDRALAFAIDARWPDAASMAQALVSARSQAQSKTVRLRATNAPIGVPVTDDATLRSEPIAVAEVSATVVEAGPSSTAATIATARRARPPERRRRLRSLIILGVLVVSLVAALVVLSASLGR